MAKAPKKSEEEILAEIEEAQRLRRDQNVANFRAAAKVAKKFFKVDKPAVSQVSGVLEVAVDEEGEFLDEGTLFTILEEARDTVVKDLGGGDEGDIFAVAVILASGEEAMKTFRVACELAKLCDSPAAKTAETVVEIYDALVTGGDGEI